MEDLKTHNDYSVRNASGTIIQFSYGEDGMDYCKIENQACDLLENNYDEIEKSHRFFDNEDFASYLNNSTIKEMKSVKNIKQFWMISLKNIVDSIHFFEDMYSKILCHLQFSFQLIFIDLLIVLKINFQ